MNLKNLLCLEGRRPKYNTKMYVLIKGNCSPAIKVTSLCPSYGTVRQLYTCTLVVRRYYCQEGINLLYASNDTDSQPQMKEIQTGYSNFKFNQINF